MKTLRWILLLLLAGTVVSALSLPAAAIPPFPPTSTLEGHTWEAPGTIGSTTPNTGVFTTITDTGVTGILKCAGASACSQASSGSDYLLPGISDYQWIPIDAGMESVLGSPNAAIRVQGPIGSTIAPTMANVTYSTFTLSQPNVTSAVWGSGTQTGTLTIATLTVGKIYRLQFTPTIANQVPTLVATSGVAVSTIPALVTTVQETIYFRASATTAVFTFSNTATSSWSTTGTTCFEYSRPATAREYSNTVVQTLVFDWAPPIDWNAGTITVMPYGVISETAPTNTQYATFSISGFCVATSGSLSQAIGTAQTSTMTFDASYVLYDEWIGPATSAITLPGAASGTKCRIMLERLTGDTYAQAIGSTGFLIKFGRTLAP